MAYSKQVHVILSTPFTTNRAFLARMLHSYFVKKGLEQVSIENVPVVDYEPPCDVEKGPVIAGRSSFVISEHQMCRPHRLDADSPEPPFVCRPSVPQQFGAGASGIAVIGSPNCGKSTIMKLIVDCLAEAEVSRTCPQRIETLGDEPLPTSWMAEQNVPRLNEREIGIYFHVRRSISHSTLEEILASCDKVQV